MDNNGKHYIFHRIIITISFSSKYHISNFSKKFPSSILFLYTSLCLFFYRKFFGQNRKVYLSSNYFLRFLLLFFFLTIFPPYAFSILSTYHKSSIFHRITSSLFYFLFPSEIANFPCSKDSSLLLSITGVINSIG